MREQSDIVYEAKKALEKLFGKVRKVPDPFHDSSKLHLEFFPRKRISYEIYENLTTKYGLRGLAHYNGTYSRVVAFVTYSDGRVPNKYRESIIIPLYELEKKPESVEMLKSTPKSVFFREIDIMIMNKLNALERVFGVPFEKNKSGNYITKNELREPHQLRYDATETGINQANISLENEKLCISYLYNDEEHLLNRKSMPMTIKVKS